MFPRNSCISESIIVIVAPNSGKVIRILARIFFDAFQNPMSKQIQSVYLCSYMRGGATECFEVLMISNNKTYKVWSKDDGDPLITSRNADELIDCIERY